MSPPPRFFFYSKLLTKINFRGDKKFISPTESILTEGQTGQTTASIYSFVCLSVFSILFSPFFFFFFAWVSTFFFIDLKEIHVWLLCSLQDYLLSIKSNKIISDTDERSCEIDSISGEKKKNIESVNWQPWTGLGGQSVSLPSVVKM